MFGFAITATSLYGLLGWSPAYLMRTFDFLCLNAILGLAVGSALIGFINDQAFSGQGTGAAMASVVTVAALMSVLLLAFGRAPYACATRAIPT